MTSRRRLIASIGVTGMQARAAWNLSVALAMAMAMAMAGVVHAVGVSAESWRPDTQSEFQTDARTVARTSQAKLVGELLSRPPRRSDPRVARFPGVESTGFRQEEVGQEEVGLANANRFSFEPNGILANRFPALPPDPYEDVKAALPDLQDELWQHGGSYLYAAEGDRLDWPGHGEGHDLLRLPADWQAPEPLTAFADFMGADPIRSSPLTWLGPGEYNLEPRFVGYGSYEIFGFAFQQSDTRRDAIGQQLLVDLDLRLTGTERFHVQFRPLGRRNTGGSYYQFSEPEGYLDNATAEPDRYWFEGELHSLLGWGNDRMASRNTNFVIGKFPFRLHNSLMMNDDIVGGVIGQNNVPFWNTSNLNVQLFAGINDVDSFAFVESQAYGAHGTLDYRQAFFEATYAYVQSDFDRDAHYAGLSRTKFYGPTSVAIRGLFKWGDRGGTGSGQLLTVETNRTRAFQRPLCGVNYGVFFCNAFWATEGWNSIAGGNLNRLRTAFEVDPLVRLAITPAGQETVGVALGVQLFRNHEDEFLVPELAWESRGGDSVAGAGLRYQKKTSARSNLEILGIANWSENDVYERNGIFVSHRWLF